MKTLKVSQYILPTSANLMGICFAIFSYIKVGNLSNSTLIDDLITIPIALFFLASLLSYLALRTEGEKSISSRLEQIADILFLLGLFVLMCLSLLVILGGFQ